MITSIDGALKSLNSALNTLDEVVSTLTNDAPGGRGTFINIRPAGTVDVPTFGPTKVFSSFDLKTSFQGKNATDDMAKIKSAIRNRIAEDPRRGQNAIETVIGPWEPEEDNGKDGVVEVLTVIIRTEEAAC